MENIEDGDNAPHHSLQAQLARAIVAAMLIATAAWMLGSYFLDTLGVPFLAK